MKIAINKALTTALNTALTTALNTARTIDLTVTMSITMSITVTGMEPLALRSFHCTMSFINLPNPNPKLTLTSNLTPI